MNVGFLRKCSVTYLLLPNLLFCAGWFKQPYATILIVGFLYLLRLEYLKKDIKENLSFKDVLYLIFFACVWTFFCGVDGLSTQTLDWLAHNSKFYDLYKNPWPNYFPEVDRASCYYFGYYLVPAFLSKLSGKLLPSVIILWTALGFFLGLSWMFILIGRNKMLLFLMPFIRGIGQTVALILAKLDIYHAQIVIINPSLRSVFQQSLFATNQVIPALIVCGIVLYDCFFRKRIDDSFLVIVISFIWAVFPSMMLVLIFGGVFINKYLIQLSPKDFFKVRSIHTYLIPGLLFIPIFIYFLSADQISDQGFLWNFPSKKGLLFGYISGIVFDLIIFYIMIRLLSRKEFLYPSWFIFLLFLLLLLLSTYYMGMFNDSFFRGSIPVYIIILIIGLRGLNNSFRNKNWPSSPLFYVAGILITGLLAVQLRIETHFLKDNIVVNHYYPEKTEFTRFPYDTCANTYQTIKLSWGVKGANEYLAAKNSIFEKYLSRKPVK